MKVRDDNTKKSGMNVLHREAGAPTAGGADRESASGEETAKGKLTGTTEPTKSKSKTKDGGALISQEADAKEEYRENGVGGNNQNQAIEKGGDKTSVN